MIGRSECSNVKDLELEQHDWNPVAPTLGELLRAHERLRRLELSEDVL
jgi:hypothetical protein